MEPRDTAIALRQAGRSLREIKAELGVSDHRLTEWLRGFAPAEWTKRPNAKDELREQARVLRLAGKTYDEIVADLGVSKSSVSLWVRDLPKPPPRDRAEHARMMNERRWEPIRRREAERLQTMSAAMAEVGQLSDRELLLIGAALYWAEGSKDKPWARREQVYFINSDPDVIRVFERWLDLVGVPRGLRRRVSTPPNRDGDLVSLGGRSPVALLAWATGL